MQETNEHPSPTAYLSSWLSLLSTPAEKRGCTGCRKHPSGVEMVFRLGRQRLTAPQHITLGGPSMHTLPQRWIQNDRVSLLQCLDWDAPQWTYLLLSAGAPACLPRGTSTCWRQLAGPNPLNSCSSASLPEKAQVIACSCRGAPLLGAAWWARLCQPRWVPTPHTHHLQLLLFPAKGGFLRLCFVERARNR